MKNKDYSQEFVHLLDLFTHYNKMHGTYNVKLVFAVEETSLKNSLTYTPLRPPISVQRNHLQQHCPLDVCTVCAF
jgi:hypothetical protein